MQLLSSLLVILFSCSIWATEQNSTPLSEPICRAQAKELAKKRYDLCMKRVKQEDMKRLHKQYKERIENLKLEYEREIKKLKEDTQEESSEGSNTPLKKKKVKTKVARGV